MCVSPLACISYWFLFFIDLNQGFTSTHHPVLAISILVCIIVVVGITIVYICRGKRRKKEKQVDDNDDDDDIETDSVGKRKHRSIETARHRNYASSK